MAAAIAAKSPTIIRRAKESLNGIDPVDVKRSYRFEQGFTYELSLGTDADEARQAFVGEARGGLLMADKRLTHEEVVAELRSGMTIGIGGWGSRRKPMSLVRALLRSDVTDLTVVSYGGPDVGLLCTAGKVRKLVFGFVSLDSIPLEPHFRAARQSGAIDAMELDEGMLQWGLYAAANRLPFLPTRAGLGSDVLAVNPELQLVADPYGDGKFVAMPALRLDAALIHVNRADARGNGQFLGPDPYFDDLFCLAADRAYMSARRSSPPSRCWTKGPCSRCGSTAPWCTAWSRRRAARTSPPVSRTTTVTRRSNASTQQPRRTTLRGRRSSSATSTYPRTSTRRPSRRRHGAQGAARE